MSTGGGDWYLAEPGGQPTGPFTTEQVLQKLQAAEASASTLCWRQGMAQWTPIGQVEPFRQAAAQASAGRSSLGGVHSPGTTGPGLASSTPLGGPPGTPSPAAKPKQPPGPPTVRPGAVLPSPTPSSPGPAGIPPGTPPSRFSSQLATLAPWIGLGAGVLLVLLVVVLIAILGRSSSGPSDGKRSQCDFVKILQNYVHRFRAAASKTSIQKEEAEAEADRRFQEDLKNCRQILITGKVKDVLREGGNTWAIQVEEIYPVDKRPLELITPEEIRFRVTYAEAKVVVELNDQHARSINKGDPVTIQGSLTVEKLREFGCADMEILRLAGVKTGSSINCEVQGVFGYNTIMLRFEEGTTCSIGSLKRIPVVCETRGPRLKKPSPSIPEVIPPRMPETLER